MNRLSFSVSESLYGQLLKIAKSKGCSVEELAVSALSGYAADCEDEARTDLCMVDNLERSFFLALGE